MTKISPHPRAIALVSIAGLGLSVLSLVSGARAQTVDVPPATATTSAAAPATHLQAEPSVSPGTAPSATDQKQAADMVHVDANGRRFAARDTFYLLSYVSVKTDKGVEGFDPGQEVHLVEVRRDSHTLVVSNGRAQVEVPPSKLTNDLDIAALVRRKDKANQAQIAAYAAAEEAAYAKAQREAADATAKDLEHRQQMQADDTRMAEQRAQTSQQPTPAASAPVSGNGYYDNGGYGYGNPYSYFVVAPPALGNAPGAEGAAPSVGNAPAQAPGRAAAPAQPPGRAGAAPGRPK